MLVKICGIKTNEAADAVVEGNGDFLGMIFVKGRKRYLDPGLAEGISDKHKSIKKVGVFLDEDLERVNTIADFTCIDYVQLHGHESAEYASKIGLPVIKAFRWHDDFDVEAINKYPCEIVLIDSFNKKTNGGTGEVFNWHEAVKEIKMIKKPVLIAGGITEDNIFELKELFPDDNIGVDVSSSLEINNCKSPEKIRSFLKKSKGI